MGKDKRDKSKALPLFEKDGLLQWKEEWKGMPEFIQDDLEAFKTISVNFATLEDMVTFSKLIKQPLTITTKSIWFPEIKYKNILHARYVDDT